MSLETLSLLQSNQLIGAKRISLSCGLTEFPVEILDLADSLEILDLSNNSLSALPDNFGRLKHLKAAFFVNNAFEEIPEVLSHCPQLSIIGFKSNQIQSFSEQALPPQVRWLTLTNNRLEALPASIGSQQQLQKLMLAGNRLSRLPAEMAACKSLELIRLSANRLEDLPAWLLELPRLAWLAFAGNPFCHAGADGQALPWIEWDALALEDSLGEGASGIIAKAIWQKAPAQSQSVAVKLFKGEMTSDGLPQDEMQSWMAAGVHENLVRVLGQVANHPQQTQGLVLSLISPDYTNLGTPPSLESCTRDVFTQDRILFPQVLRIAKGISSAAAHLHHQNILHGDLYAHNILVNQDGQCLLGDFGAASRYRQESADCGEALQRIEVRAFGYLLEDLLNLCPTASEQPLAASLSRLKQDCLQTSPALRPLFESIYSELDNIQRLLSTALPS